MKITIHKIYLLLLFFVIMLLAMNFFPESLSETIHNRFNLNLEANIPTWFSTVLLFSVALTSLLIYIFELDIKNHISWHSFWLIFSVVYCFLSLDEAARIHEIFDETLHLKWIFVYAPFGGIFFLICSYYLIIVNKKTTLRNWILGGLIVFALGGLVGESIAYFSLGFSIVEIILEEGFELLGTIMVLSGCLQELSSLYRVEYKNKINYT